MRKILGWILAIILFCSMIWAISLKTGGILFALLVVGISVGITALIILAIRLIMD